MTGRIEIACILKHETKAAYLINDGTRDAWIPKSRCGEFMSNGPGMVQTGTLEIDELVAQEKGLI